MKSSCGKAPGGFRRPAARTVWRPSFRKGGALQLRGGAGVTPTRSGQSGGDRLECGLQGADRGHGDDEPIHCSRPAGRPCLASAKIQAPDRRRGRYQTKAVANDWNVPERLVPTFVTAVMMMTATRAAMIPYSMAVTPA